MAKASEVNSGVLKHNFKSVEVGTAEYKNGPTGVTVLYFPIGAIGAVDIRGGAAAVREASSVSSFNTWAWVDALVLAGGSTYGLEAADGVTKSLLELRKNSTKFDDIPAVPAAIVYDFTGRDNALYPDKALGAKAFKNRKKGEVPFGRKGAGRFVTIGKYMGRKFAENSGQAVGYIELGDVKILIISVVNALGNIVDENGQIIAGSVDPKSGENLQIADYLIDKMKKSQKPEQKSKGNTTITALVTNVKMSRSDIQRVAMMAHTGMAKTIQPFHTPSDGDSFFAVTTREVEMPKGFDAGDIGTIGSDLINKSIIKMFSK